ncbi:MAG: hypothetical protein MUC36_02980 [Planctomycetes bacterium]|jgi:hypothetical protein|nr:hypothetical protein [Planctomycetota bacterium]
MKLSPISPLASLLLLAAPVMAQGSISILPFLPKDTMMAVAAPDLSMSMTEFAQMPLAKMWAEEDVQAFFADLKAMAMKQFDEGMKQAKEMHAQGALPFDPEQVMQLKLRGATFAVTQMQLTMGDFGPMPKFGMVLHLDFGPSAPKWMNVIQAGLGMMEQEAGDDMQKTEGKIGDIATLSYMPKNGRGSEMGLNLAMVPEGILIGTLGADVQGIVDNMVKKSTVLTQTAQYMATAKQIDVGGAECEMFMRPQPMIDFAMGAMRMGAEQGAFDGVDMDGVERALKAMGLTDLGAIGSASKYVDGKAVTQGFVSASKMTATMVQKPIDTSFLKWVPKEAVGFSSGTVDAMSLYDMLDRGLKAYDPEFAKQAMDQLAQVEKQLGFNIRNDFFGSLGNHYISWSMPMGSISSAPEMAFLMKVNDEQKLVTVIKNLAKMSDGMVEIEEGEKRGVMAYQLRVNFDPSEGMGMNPFDFVQPTFAFKNGYMVLGFSASDVKRVFQRMDREDDPKGDIRSNKEYAAVAGSIPAGIDSVSFTDWKVSFESLYQIATGALAFVPISEEVPIDMSLLPDSATLTKHLFGSVSYTKTDADGQHSFSSGPFGPEAMLLVGAVGVGVMTAVASMRGGF